MLPRCFALAILLPTLLSGPAFAKFEAPNSTAPSVVGLRLPARGFVDVEGFAAAKPKGLTWTRRRAGSVELFVGTDGPHGSGRYWTVAVGTARPGQRQPVRGVVLETATAGWRTLGKFQNRPLPWVEDLDRDGKPEFILWEDFPLEPERVMNGLIARVFTLASPDSFALDWEQSRALARQLAKEYRTPSTDPMLRPLRAAAADSLEAFADGRAGN